MNFISNMLRLRNLAIYMSLNFIGQRTISRVKSARVICNGHIMEEYEIRITKKGDQKPQIIRAALASAYAAIRRAVKLAEDGDLIEVWLGLTCVYSTAGASA